MQSSILMKPHLRAEKNNIQERLPNFDNENDGDDKGSGGKISTTS